MITGFPFIHRNARRVFRAREIDDLHCHLAHEFVGNEFVNLYSHMEELRGLREHDAIHRLLEDFLDILIIRNSQEQNWVQTLTFQRLF